MEYRTPSTFRVSGESIQSNGKTFGKADIHRLIIKNGLTDEEVGVPRNGRAGLRSRRRNG
jgi:hypothetical protein